MFKYALAAFMAVSTPAAATWSVERLSPGLCMAMKKHHGRMFGIVTDANNDRVGFATEDKGLDQRAAYSMRIRADAGPAMAFPAIVKDVALVVPSVADDVLGVVLSANSVAIDGFGVFPMAGGKSAVARSIACSFNSR